MNVVVLGGTGYIGSYVALDLARRGHHVTAVARPPARGSSNAARMVEMDAAGIRLLHADLSRPGALAEAVDPEPVEVIVHGVCSFLEPAEAESLTVRAMTEMLALAARCPRLVQAIDLSNNLVMEPDGPDDLPNEDHACHPRTVHGKNKLLAEQMLQQSGLPWVVLRFPQVYGGVGSSFDWIMVDPIRRKAFPVPCDGTNRVSLIHVEDVTQAVRRVIEQGIKNRVYHFASGERDLTLGQVFDEVARGFDLPPPMRLPRSIALAAMGAAERWAQLWGRDPEMVADMVWTLAVNRAVDIRRAQEELGFAPAYPDSLAGIRTSYAEIFAGRADPFTPPRRLAAVRGKTANPTDTPVDPADFWRRWGPWRHGDPGEGTFADVMRVLHLPDLFATFAVRQLPEGTDDITVLDLGCGSGQLAGPLDRALRARGATLRRYVGVDFADTEWMMERVHREFARNGLQDKGEYHHADLSRGLPASIAEPLSGVGPLLIVSCWGITYLDPAPLRAILLQIAALSRSRSSDTVLCINLMSPDKQDTRVLTRRFLGEVVPSHVGAAARERSTEPLRAIRLALRALPTLRKFGDELRTLVMLMPLADFEATLRSVGLEPSDRDAALWGATRSFAIRLPAGSEPKAP